MAYLGPILAPSWPYVGPSWPYVGPRLAYVGPMLAHVGPMLAHLGAYVGASLGVFLAIYVATPSRGQLFRFFPLPGAQNHAKTTVFARRQDKIRGRRGARNTVKNGVFARETQNSMENYRLQVRSGVGPRSTQGRPKVGRRQGASTHITFGYHRRPPASTRALGRRPDLKAYA